MTFHQGVGFALRSLAADMRPSEFRGYSVASKGQDLPRPARRPRRLLSPLAVFPTRSTEERLWAITMVRDEADIIGYTIAHLVSQGVERILVADNRSRDGTAELLRQLAASMPVTVFEDREPGYYQAHKMTRLARYAACSGAAWVIPFDADELWVAPGQRLREFLARAEVDVVRARMIDYLPSDSDDSAELNPYRRIRHRARDDRAVFKVAFRANRFARVAVGNHTVRHPGRVGLGLEVHHFPYRSEEQLTRKLLQGRDALMATRLKEEVASHWRIGARLVEEGASVDYGTIDQLEPEEPTVYTGTL